MLKNVGKWIAIAIAVATGIAQAIQYIIAHLPK